MLIDTQAIPPASPLLDTVFFYLFALLTLAGALLTITRRNAVHSAISLIVSLLGVAGLYLLQHAEFLFAVQIVLYVGGIMVLFLFVIMLVNLDQMAKERQFSRGWMVALLAVVAVGVEIGYFFYRGQDSFKLPDVVAPAVTLGNTEAIADVLFREYLLPFEIASILLLVAVVGSVVMAKKRI
jgi:NADH-quinone oxidoreductase subunit J